MTISTNSPGKDNKTLPSGYGKKDPKDPYSDLLRELVALHQDLTAMESESTKMLQKVDARHRASAINLIHYLGLRRRDVRSLQEKLAAAGLSSVGRAESHVLSNLDAIIILLRSAMGEQTLQFPLLPAIPRRWVPRC